MIHHPSAIAQSSQKGAKVLWKQHGWGVEEGAEGRPVFEPSPMHNSKATAIPKIH